MDKLGDVYLDLNQNETNIDDLNLNGVWVELDKGLLSENIGQQCESIVKLTELFDKFPLPVFVNSGFLRLARVFQNGLDDNLNIFVCLCFNVFKLLNVCILCAV